MAAAGPVNVLTVGKTTFELASYYELIKLLGQGAYGVVCAARDQRCGKDVAIKKITRVFDHLIDAKRTLREVKILRHFRHENIISILEIMPPHHPISEFKDLYVVTELMETDLHQVIQSEQPLGAEYVQYFLYQILRGLRYIHSAHVLHRDLKPSNLLLNGNCDLKICDFGLARVADPSDQSQSFLTEYVATRWYRAPEVMLSWRQYTKAIDMWSVGCIFAEMWTRRPIFAGKDFLHQLNLIFGVLGTPSPDEIASITSDRARRYVQSLPPRPRIPFATLFPGAPPAAVDLLEGLLTFSPDRRLTVEQALEHPYLADIHDPSDEPVASVPFDFSFESLPLTAPMIKEVLYNDACSFASGGGGEEGPAVAAMQDISEGVSAMEL